MLKKAQEREDKIMEKRRHMQVMQLIKGIKLKTTHMIVREMILIFFIFSRLRRKRSLLAVPHPAHFTRLLGQRQTSGAHPEGRGTFERASEVKVI